MLWQVFSRPAPEGGRGAQPSLRVLDFRSALLYLCGDRDLFSGIKKAFSVATQNIAGNARATAEQVGHQEMRNHSFERHACKFVSVHAEHVQACRCVGSCAVGPTLHWCALCMQIHHVAYPFGREAAVPLHKAPLDLEAIRQVVAAVYAARGGAPDCTPAISAEQLMYSAAGERVVTHLLGRYQWHDLFIATKMQPV